jgi:hypothetical protein
MSEQAINAMIGAAYLRDPGEAVAALINCIGNVVSSIECADCGNSLVGHAGVLDEGRLHGLTGEEMFEIIVKRALQKMELN